MADNPAGDCREDGNLTLKWEKTMLEQDVVCPKCSGSVFDRARIRSAGGGTVGVAIVCTTCHQVLGVTDNQVQAKLEELKRKS